MARSSVAFALEPNGPPPYVPDVADNTAAHPSSQAALREANRRRVLTCLQAAGAMTQVELARATSLSPATISNIVRELDGAGLLHVSPTVSSGRRARAVTVNPRAGIAAGIDFGRRHVRVVVADLAHEVLGEHEELLAAHLPADEAISLTLALLDGLLAELGLERTALVGVGAGLPGPVDGRTGEVGASSVLPEWVGLVPAAALGARLGVPVTVDNDANLGVLAEARWGAAQGEDNVVYLKVSSGIGAGLLLGGQLYRGQSGTAGEIGHTTIDEDGIVCRCGSRGCLETVASVPVILELLRHSYGDITIEQVLAQARQGDTGCRRVIEDVGRHIGAAVANMCNLLNPGLVVVGGALAPAADLLLDPIRYAVRRYAIPTASGTRVVVSALGPRATALGALAIGLRSAQLALPSATSGPQPFVG